MNGESLNPPRVQDLDEEIWNSDEEIRRESQYINDCGVNRE